MKTAQRRHSSGTEYLAGGIYVERSSDEVIVSAQIWPEGKFGATRVCIRRQKDIAIEDVDGKRVLVNYSKPRMCELGHADMSWSADQMRTYAQLLTWSPR